MKFTGICLTALLTISLAGCESLSPSECATADWRQLGAQDAARGTADRSAAYFESCSKANIAVDLKSYRAGREEGLRGYCQPGNAIRVGLAGQSYHGICPASQDQSFRSIYDAARRARASSDKVERLERKENQMQAELTNSKTSNNRRNTLRDMLSRADREIRDARDDQRDAEEQLERLRQDLQRRGLL